jgi:hypothetical protein
MPSPLEDRPGLLMRDPLHFSDVTLILPPFFVPMLEFFDGEHSADDLRREMLETTGDLGVGELVEHLVDSLTMSGFLEDETYAAMRAERERQFTESESRWAVHAGSAYPEAKSDLERTMLGYLQNGEPADGEWIGIAAPHVSPDGGWKSYRSAYAGLSKNYAGRVFVILGTSHYGQPEKFGLTRKRWTTPWGAARPASGLIDELAEKGGEAVLMEDYCHAVEHSVEFQVVFLQSLFGPDIQILPILCGPYARSIYQGGMPEQDDGVKRFLDVLGEIGAREGNRLFWVLGVDMAHIGRRYGDSFEARADVGQMAEIAERDHRRIDAVNAGDADRFWELVKEKQDDLKWCGSSPFYTFLRAMPQSRGVLRRYEQWNIDPQSVVSFAGIHFSEGGA